MATAGNIQFLKQVLGSPVIFEVPDFQRNYSWQEEQIDALVEDVMDAREQLSPHFIGSLITMKDPDHADRILVIDGQQRLTTIFMLVAVMRDAVARLDSHEIEFESGQKINVLDDLNNFLFMRAADGTYKLHQRFMAHPMISNLFSESVLANPFPNRVKLPTRHHNYSLALRKGHSRLTKWLAQELESLVLDEEKLSFVLDILNVLNGRITLLQIDTESIPEAFDIFMSLNSTGLPLGPSDLVKTELFRVLTRDLSADQREVRTAELTSIWQTISTNLDAGDIDQFLRHYLLSTQNEKVQKKKIYPNFELQISSVTPGLSPVAHAQKILDTLLEASGIYEEILECSAVQDAEAQRSLRTLLEVGASYRVLLLAALDPDTGLSDSDKEALISSLESFNMRWVLVGKNAQELESMYQKYANGLRRKELTVSKVIERFTVEAPGDDAVLATFQEPVSSAPIVKLILFRIEQHNLDQVLPTPAKSLHIDWIAPQKDSPAWISTLFPAETEDMTLEYSTTVEQWGNKVIVDPAVPIPARSASFSEKVSGTPEFMGYENSQFATTRELAKLTAWNRQAIKARNTAIGQAACDIWRL
jgi:hypothetical protein